MAFLDLIRSLFLPEQDENDGLSSQKEPVGLHVYSEYGNVHKFVTDAPTEALIVETLDGLDWQEFHQVVLVKAERESLEVGGSLDPKDGLSSVYRHQQTTSVTEVPPETVNDMKSILCSFHRGDGLWCEKYTYS